MTVTLCMVLCLFILFICKDEGTKTRCILVEEGLLIYTKLNIASEYDNTITLHTKQNNNILGRKGKQHERERISESMDLCV